MRIDPRASEPIMRIATASALTLWLITSAPALPARAEEASKLSCRDAATTALQRRYESARDLRADIVQTTHSVALGTASEQMTSKGTVVFAKPGKMRWSYDEPEPSLVVSDGTTLWIYDPTFR
ncbi:MAG: outer membrane lipoprotein carrier protein LolA, partial [Deltaproteobacteria bacterium]|nr:outer membrane lipoprotein carrier protein LolA [Deltaproteobacteria bacterium]